MNCIVPGSNLKVIAKALYALAKVGEDLYIEARKERICLIALNLRKTVCVQFNLLDSFFSSYEIDHSALIKDNEAITCKIQMKTLLPLFKGTHLDKKFDYVRIMYQNNSDVLVFEMKYRCDDIVMMHNLRLMDPETLTIEIRPDEGTSNILTTSSLYNQLLGLFGNSDEEITLEISKNRVIARNYCVGAPVKPKCVRSQVNLNSYEFNCFQVSSETNINFSIKPFRTAINFGESFNLNIGLNFEKGGKPLAITMKNPTFEVSFLVATLNPYSDLQSTIATTSIPTKITQHNVNLTIEDQDAIQNEDWNFEMEEIPVKAKRKKKNTQNPFQNIIETVNDSVRTRKKLSSILEGSPMETDESESPQCKKAKLVFSRCLEATFSVAAFGSDILVPNSDSE